MTADGDAQVCASVVSVAIRYSILPVFDQWRRSQQKLKSFFGYYTKSGALCLRMEVDPTEILAISSPCLSNLTPEDFARSCAEVVYDEFVTTQDCVHL